MSEPIRLAAAEQTEQAAACLARALLASQPEQLCIHLEGQLGAGKTCFARGFLRALGHQGRVPSPTYTLIEPYECAGYRVFHMDLYRLQDGAELEFLGVDEMTGPGTVLLIEWPDRAGGLLQSSDIEVLLKVISEGRELTLLARSQAGEKLTREFDQQIKALSP